MLVIDRETVSGLLDPAGLIDALAPAMEALSRNEVSLPPRIAAMADDQNGLLGAMPVYLPSAGLLVCKLVSVFPGNAAKGIHTHNATIHMFDAETGVPTALIDGGLITGERTAAGSALATRHLAKSDAATLAIIGSGVQAETHGRAIPLVRDISVVKITGRDRGKAEELARRLAQDSDAEISVSASVEEAVADADIVCTCTHAAAPILDAAWLPAGAHVNSVGLNPAGRELDPQLVKDAAVFVESRSSALAASYAGSNDLLWPIRDGLITEDHIRAEIGEVISGTAPGRLSADEVTLYKSVGVGVQDAIAAQLVHKAAVDQGLGREIQL